MSTADWIVASVVIVSLIYLSFVLTLADWFRALRKGQAVTLLPEHQGKRRPIWIQALIVLLGILLCVPLFYYGWIPLFPISQSTAKFLGMLGLAVYLIGIALTLWARRTLGRFWGISTSTNVKLLDDHQLIQTGPYALIRHPMYFGWWVAMLGLTMTYPVWAVFLLFLFSVISFIGRAHREEAVLAERFGTAWQEYRKRTKRLIPYVY